MYTSLNIEYLPTAVKHFQKKRGTLQKKNILVVFNNIDLFEFARRTIEKYRGILYTFA